MNWIKQTITKLFSNKSKEQSLDEKLALQVLANTDIDEMETYSGFSLTYLTAGSFKFVITSYLNRDKEVSLWHDYQLIARFKEPSEVRRLVCTTYKEIERRKHEKLVKGLLEKVGEND